jgi:hypothetical protein
MTDVLGLDIATTCGWARGTPGGTPTFGSVAFKPPGIGASDAAIFAKALTFFSMLMATPPSLLVIEALLPAAARVKTNKATRDRLAGLHSVALAVAHCRGVHRIVEADVADVRAHFIQARILRRATAKAEVMRNCRRLGWDVADDNQGDACAVWSYGCALVDPRSALRISPLFQRGVAL